MVTGFRVTGVGAVRTAIGFCLLACCALLLALGALSYDGATAARAASVTQTPPPDVPLASPTPQPLLINGQVIDIERGYVVFSTGDALRADPAMRITDASSGAPPAYELLPGIFAIATLDAKTGMVLALQTSRKPLAGGVAAAQVPRQFVIAASSPKPNPDLQPRRAAFTSVLSRAVTVTLNVSVPPDTPFSDDVYMTTDTSGWNAQAIKMQRIDGLHFSIQLELKGGTEIHYLFTRGSWNTVERDRSGLQRKARTLFVPGGDAQVVETTVYRWADLP